MFFDLSMLYSGIIKKETGESQPKGLTGELLCQQS